MLTKYKKKKTNIIQKTPWGYARVFFNNTVGKGRYFIIDDKYAELFEAGMNATAVRRINGDIDPYITVDGKKIKLSNYLRKTDTANGKQCDHLNHQTLDCRISNLRNCSQIENQANTKKGVGQIKRIKGGKYTIVFPEAVNCDTSKLIFDTKAEAKIKLKELQIELFGEFAYEISQRIANEIETYEFKLDWWKYCWAHTGTLGKIMNLSPLNSLNARLRNLIVLSNRGVIYPDEEWRMEEDLKYDYYQFLKVNKI